MSKHTPGPWTTEGDGIRTIVRGGDMTIVAVRHRLPGSVHEANARLIAAAPDMYEALQDLLKTIEEWPTLHPGGDYLHGGALLRSKAAIAKATGEQ